MHADMKSTAQVSVFAAVVECDACLGVLKLPTSLVVARVDALQMVWKAA